MVHKQIYCLIISSFLFSLGAGLLAEEKKADDKKKKEASAEKVKEKKSDDEKKDDKKDEKTSDDKDAKKDDKKEEKKDKASSLAEGESPQWPNTVQFDKASEIVEGGHQSLKQNLFEKANKLTLDADEVITVLRTARKKAFEGYRKVQDLVRDFSLKTKVSLGKLKNPDTGAKK